MQQKYRNRRLHLNLTTLSSKTRDPKVAYRYLCIPILANYLQFILFRNLMLIPKRSNRFLCGKKLCILHHKWCIWDTIFYKKISREHYDFFRGNRGTFRILTETREHIPSLNDPQGYRMRFVCSDCIETY